MVVEKHKIHKYKKIIFKSGHTIFRCMIPGCSHFIRRELLLGKFSICWRCGEEFIITDTELLKQHCNNCTKRRKKIVTVSDKMIDTLLDILGTPN